MGVIKPFVLLVSSLGFAMTSARAAGAAESRVAVSGSLSAAIDAYDGDVTGESKRHTIVATPAIDWLHPSGVTLGFGAELNWTRYRHAATNAAPGSESSATFALPGARIGYFLPLGEHAAFWPTASVSYGAGWVHTESSSGGISDPKGRIFAVAFEPSLVLMPTRSVFLRFSPGSLAYKSTRWEGQSPSGGILGVSTDLSMGIGVML